MARSPRISAHPSPTPVATTSGQLAHPAEFTKIKPLDTSTSQTSDKVFFTSKAWGTMVHTDSTGQMYLSFRPTSMNLVTVGGVIGLVVLATVFKVLKTSKMRKKQIALVMAEVPEPEVPETNEAELPVIDPVIEETEVPETIETEVTETPTTQPEEQEETVVEPERPKIRRLTL